MKNIINSLFVLSIIILATTQNYGQVLTPSSKGSQTIYVNAGLDPAVLTSLGVGIFFSELNKW